jgi:hypothetical protein
MIMKTTQARGGLRALEQPRITSPHLRARLPLASRERTGTTPSTGTYRPERRNQRFSSARNYTAAGDLVLLRGSNVSIQGGPARRGQGARSRAYPEGT